MSRLTKQLFAPLRMLFCSSLFSSPDHRLGMSLPARAGLFTLLCLLGVTVGMLIAEVGLASIGGFIKSHLMSSWIVALVLVAAPVAVMLVASRFVTRVDCEFRDIEDAWQEGMRVLRVRGISLSETPLFLVVGPRDAEEARAVVEASDIKFDVKGLPFGESPLIWFASQDAIFLACPGASQVSLLTNSVLGHSVDSDNPLSTITEKSLFRQTVGAVMDFIAASSELEAPKSSFGFGSKPDPGDSGPSQPLYDISNPGSHLLASGSATALPAGPRSKQRVSVDTQALAVATRKLETVCRLLEQYREPRPALNGVLSFLPVTMVTTSDHHASALVSAVAFDNDVICRNIGLRAHQVIMVGGMEQETGFRELIRRFGPDVSLRNRIGKGNPHPWCDPTGDSLEALARHACGAFEDNVYPLFAKDHELREPGNPRLYKLLCVSRQRLTNRLARILRSGYSYERDFAQSLPVLGCYFAATGLRPDRRAFAASVFRKLMQHAPSLDWHPQLRRANERFVSWTNMLLGVNLALVAFIVLLLTT